MDLNNLGAGKRLIKLLVNMGNIRRPDIQAAKQHQNKNPHTPVSRGNKSTDE